MVHVEFPLEKEKHNDSKTNKLTNFPRHHNVFVLFSPDIEISARNNKHHKNELDLQDYLLDSNDIGKTSRRKKFAVY